VVYVFPAEISDGDEWKSFISTYEKCTTEEQAELRPFPLAAAEGPFPNEVFLEGVRVDDNHTAGDQMQTLFPHKVWFALRQKGDRERLGKGWVGYGLSALRLRPVAIG
jgi:hypothetical protein